MAALCWLTMSAQDGFKVKFEGVAPDIMDFALAYFTFMDDDPENTPDEWMNGVRKSLQCYLTGDEQPQGFTITVDKKAGYILIKQTDKDGEFTHRYEMCYWNMADQKHKLFALNVELWQEGMRLNPITVTKWNEATGKKTTRTLKWNGRGFGK